MVLKEQIVNLLNEKPGFDSNQIAAALGAARPTVQHRITRMENAGVITGYTVTVGASATQAGTSCMWCMISLLGAFTMLPCQNSAQ